jgi:hypothetical protein
MEGMVCSGKHGGRVAMQRAEIVKGYLDTFWTIA